jgi:hypothetical protein
MKKYDSFVFCLFSFARTGGLKTIVDEMRPFLAIHFFLHDHFSYSCTVNTIE